MGNKEGNYEHIKLGVRQGCALSPDLFSLYSEVIMREIKEKSGIILGGYNINNIRYADDTVLMMDDAKDLQQLLDIVVIEVQRKDSPWISRNAQMWNRNRREHS